MTSKTKKLAIPVAAAAAIFSMAGLVCADEGGDYVVQVAFVTGGSEPAVQASCNDRLELARFERELGRTDGDVSPIAPEASCRAEIYANATVDAD